MHTSSVASSKAAAAWAAAATGTASTAAAAAAAANAQIAWSASNFLYFKHKVSARISECEAICIVRVRSCVCILLGVRAISSTTNVKWALVKLCVHMKRMWGCGWLWLCVGLYVCIECACTCVCIIISIAAVCVFVCEAQCGVIPADSVPLPRRMLLYAAESCANLHMPNEDESYQECV